jgi:hypothetical protein
MTTVIAVPTTAVTKISSKVTFGIGCEGTSVDVGCGEVGTGSVAAGVAVDCAV